MPADFEVKEAGVYDIPEDVYHRDPVPEGSLSQSGAKKLLQEGGPALFAYERENPPEPSEAMELGTAAHKLVLGVGKELHEVKFDNYNKNDAKKDRDDARAAGKLPLLSKDMRTVEAMAAELRKHKRASQLLSQPGQKEASAFWYDEQFKIWRRCRFDLMPEPHAANLPVITDYKTTASAAPSKFSASLANFGYHQQDDWYCAAYRALFGHVISRPPVFVLIAQETKAPYRVACYQMPPPALKLGRQLNERAMRIYAHCTETGEWPGYDPDVQWLDLPYWAYKNEDYQ